MSCRGPQALAAEGRATVAVVKRARLPDPELLVDGEPVRCRLSYQWAGALQLTLCSVCPDLGVELHSSYMGHPDAEVSIIGTIRLRPGVRPEVTSDLRDAATLPVREARRRCLLDHLAELRDLVAEASEGEVSIEFADEAAELVDVA